MTEANVSFAGNLTEDPEVRYTEGGIARAMFRVAVSGRRGHEASFFTVVVWRDQAEQAASRCRRAAGSWSWAGSSSGAGPPRTAAPAPPPRPSRTLELAVADVGAEDAAWQHGRTMPSDRDWAHDPRYDDAALEQFEERLRRANRASRPGYLRVKGGTLLRHGDPAAIPAAIRLLHRATESDDFIEVPWAHELLGQAYRKMGDPDAAEHHYRQCMATADEHRSGTTKVTKLFLAEVLLQRDERGDLAEVEELLSSPDLTQFLLWSSHIFRYYVAQAHLALRQGHDPRDWAAMALELAGDRRPQLPRHPTVGVVDPDPDVIAELRVLAQEW